ncbi:phage tail protein [Lacticaseibacillus sp. GG6-2]
MVDLIIDGKALGESVPGTYLTSKPPIPAAARDVKTTDVPGRKNGSLTQKLGWKDTSWSPTLQLVDVKNINDAWRKTKAILQSATKLAFSDDTGFYYVVKSCTPGELTIDTTDVIGTYKPTFVLDPLEYQDTLAQTFTANFDLNNPGSESSDPLLVVSGSGTVKLSVNTDEFSIDSVTADVTIDCMTHTVTMGGKDVTSSTKGDFPQFKPGVNHVVLTGATKVVVTPRWCYV